MPLTHIPCAPGAQIGEQIARDFLMKELSARFGILLTNYHHPAGNGTQEHDLLFINEQGVWAIEVKHWFGRIDADQVYWLHNGQRHPSPITSVEIKAKAIASAVREAGFERVSVVGMIALTRGDSSLRIDDPRAHKVFRLDQSLVKALTGREYLYRSSSRNLSARDIQEVAAALVRRKVDPERRIVASYRLLRELEPGDGYRAYEAQHVSITTRRARVKQYRVTGATSAAVLREAARRFQQDMQALSQVDSHPNIVRAYDFLPDPDSDDTYWLLLEWIEGLTLRERMEEDSPVAYKEQLHILRAAASALAYCHDKGLLHRNLRPSSLYLADDDMVKLGDFDFARVPSVEKTISHTGQPLVVNKYTAPELRNDARAADARSDLYALGAIWYDLVTRRPVKEPVLLTRLEGVTLPTDAMDLLRALLMPVPANRPQSAQDVSEWLQLL